MNLRPDAICVVVEVASLFCLEKIKNKYKSPAKQKKAMSEFHEDILLQLTQYLVRVGTRGNKVLGVAILGNEVTLRGAEGGNVYNILNDPVEWISFFDHRFVDHLNEMRDFEPSN